MPGSTYDQDTCSYSDQFLQPSSMQQSGGGSYSDYKYPASSASHGGYTGTGSHDQQQTERQMNNQWEQDQWAADQNRKDIETAKKTEDARQRLQGATRPRGKAWNRKY